MRAFRARSISGTVGIGVPTGSESLDSEGEAVIARTEQDLDVSRSGALKSSKKPITSISRLLLVSCKLHMNLDAVLLDKKLIFLHIEKTAGTAVTEWLCSLFPNGSMCPCRGRDIALWPAKATNEYRLFSCHANIEDFRFLEGRRRVVTFLRDPVERCVSLYKYWTSYRDTAIDRYQIAGPRLAKALGLRGLFSPDNRDQCQYVWNHYARAMCGHGSVSPSGRLWANDGEIHRAASDTLSSLFFVGISESTGESLHRLSRQLGVEDTFDGRVVNRTAQNHVDAPADFEEIAIADEITAETLDLISEANAIDIALYRDAVIDFFGEARTWRPIRCVHDASRARADGDGAWVAGDGPGYLIFGPYIHLLRGSYETSFELRATDPSLALPSLLGHVDVVSDMGRRSLFEAPILSDMFDEAGLCRIGVRFDVDVIATDVEFRVFLDQGGSVQALSALSLGKRH